MAPPDPTTTDTATAQASAPASSSKRCRLLQEAVAEAAESAASAMMVEGTESSSNPTATAITFPLGLEDGFESADLRLMEAPPEVLAALTQGQTLRVVGESREQSAALVTENATFELCRVETSNMLLLVPPVEAGATIATAAGNASFHYELKRSKPKQQLLRQLLGEGRVWSLDELETRVQGSRVEVLALLRQMNALEVDDDGQSWRAVSEEKEVSPTLDRLLTELISAGKSLEGVEEEECLRLLPDVEPVLVHHCLKAYGSPHNSQGHASSAAAAAAAAAVAAAAAAAGGATMSSPTPTQQQQQQQQQQQSSPQQQQKNRTWTLDLAKVARFKAHQIFQQGMSRPQGGVWERDAFFLEWETRLPGSFRPAADLLRGLALEERVGGEECLRYLPGETMPLDPAERLKKLFGVRKKWQLEEIMPYMLPLVPGKKDLEDFLLKHTRSAVAVDGVGGRTYSAK